MSIISNHSIDALKAKRVESGVNVGHFVVGGFSQSISVCNYTDKPLYVKTQGNVPFVVAPVRANMLRSIPEHHVEIRVTSGVVTAADFQETQALANRMISENIPRSSEAQEVFDKINAMVTENVARVPHNGVSNTLIYTVKGSALGEGKLSYIPECNVVMSYSAQLVMENHPHSNEAWSVADLRNIPELNRGAGNIIRVIDNENTRDKWYYYSAKQIVEVIAIQDKSKESGVYLNELSYGEKGNQLTTSFMSFTEAQERLGLYATREAAMTNGNPEHLTSAEEIRYKAEYEASKRQLEKLRLDLEQQKTEAARIAHEHELELSELRHKAYLKKEEIDLEATSRKDKFEERSIKRKDIFDKKEKKRKNRQEEASFMLKAAETVVKAAPLVMGAMVVLGIGFAAGRSGEKKLSGFDMTPGEGGSEFDGTCSLVSSVGTGRAYTGTVVENGKKVTRVNGNVTSVRHRIKCT